MHLGLFFGLKFFKSNLVFDATPIALGNSCVADMRIGINPNYRAAKLMNSIGLARITKAS
jgi:hypothetical protein